MQSKTISIVFQNLSVFNTAGLKVFQTQFLNTIQSATLLKRQNVTYLF